ncbi:hypothetical protein [Streptomyces orinoci]|uniref:Uncharacterized protein n=1 Tax=Streptomyces orinoci TaxID=67339 RepID=A0ABV3JYG5_STRON|nr:hypothetical protein [Streptomyces orinoci]
MPPFPSSPEAAPPVPAPPVPAVRTVPPLPPHVPPPTRTVPRFAPVRVGGRRCDGAAAWLLAAAGTLSLYGCLLISGHLG